MAGLLHCLCGLRAVHHGSDLSLPAVPACAALQDEVERGGLPAPQRSILAVSDLFSTYFKLLQGCVGPLWAQKAPFRPRNLTFWIYTLVFVAGRVGLVSLYAEQVIYAYSDSTVKARSGFPTPVDPC